MTGTGIGIGVVLPAASLDADGRSPVREAARWAEELGLDSVWVGDHLLTGGPVVDSTVSLATAAAVTERVTVGFSVFVPALRPLVWAAKQLASLQVVSGGRLVVGIGSGGPGPGVWDAAGVPAAERGRRTDRALRRLPDLLAGRPTALGDSDNDSDDGNDGSVEVTLAPAVERPPFWIGGMSTVALRRAARYGDAWFPSLVPSATVAADGARLRDHAAAGGRPAPGIAVGATLALGTGTDIDRVVRGLVGSYGMDPDVAAAIPFTGGPERAAERIDAYADAGADHLVFGVAGPDWRHQFELLAEARSLVTASSRPDAP